MINDEDVSTWYLSEQLDRCRAAMISAVNGEGEHHELLYFMLEGLNADDRQRAEDLIPTLEHDCEERYRVAREEAKRQSALAEKRRLRAARPTNPNDSRIRVMALHFAGLLPPLYRGQLTRVISDSLWERFWKKVAIPPAVLTRHHKGCPAIDDHHVCDGTTFKPCTCSPGFAWADECWPWTGATSKKRRSRRGHIQIGGRGTPVVLACRLICEWWYGPAPSEDHEAGHTCPKGENALCVNPQHLRWMTREENEQHKQTYDRGVQPEEVPFR